MTTKPQTTISGDYQFRALQHGPRLQRFWHRNKIKVMQSIMQISGVDSVVDIGCGSGNLIFQSGPDARLSIGLDISEAALRFCNGRRDGTQCVFACARGDAIPLPEAFVDVVFLIEVIEHLESPPDVLREIRRILKVGGRVFITTPNYAFPSLWPAWEWLADHSGLVPKMAGEQHVQKFGPKTLQTLLQRIGFELDCLGTFYHLSPFASMISETWADVLVSREVESRRLSGSLIYCVARKSASVPVTGTSRFSCENA